MKIISSQNVGISAFVQVRGRVLLQHWPRLEWWEHNIQIHSTQEHACSDAEIYSAVVIRESQVLRETLRAFHWPVAGVVQEFQSVIAGKFVPALATEEPSERQRELLPELVVFRKTDVSV